MDIYKDKRIVLTLDAGGTNFVFSAMQGGKIIGKEISKKAFARDLNLCIQSMIDGFEELKKGIHEEPAAISFAFPGPADYPNGIIGDLQNLPAFRGGVPLAGILNEHFKIPVFINNDGDLYAFGEALGGILPEINQKLEISGSSKRYHNLVGLTLGTGFGAGIVRNGELFLGDNSIAAEVWIVSNWNNSEANSEELVSTRAVQRIYAEKADINFPNELMPADIFNIAKGNKNGNKNAAIFAYQMMGKALGDTIANLLSLIDGIVVIGGGITGAAELYMPAVFEELNGKFNKGKENEVPRLVQKVYNLDQLTGLEDFYKNYSKELVIQGTNKTITYDPIPRLAVGTSKIGASRAISIGAYAFALSKL
jgi:glucokinase